MYGDALAGPASHESGIKLFDRIARAFTRRAVLAATTLSPLRGGATGPPSIADELPSPPQIVANVEGHRRQPASGAPDNPAAVAGGRGFGHGPKSLSMPLRPVLPDADIERGRSLRDCPCRAIRGRIVVTRMDTVLDPLPDVADHVIKTEPVGSE
jgi:hypothetical protein